MAKSSNTLETLIVINAQTGKGFTQVGSTLTELGSVVNGLSQRLIDLGEESIDVYRNYELSMRDAEVALSTAYGQGTQQLQKVMSQLDESATEWAATTIFHTNDVANAISEAAHAGWDYEQIMTGIPAAMELAQAGSLDLSEAVDYIVKSTNAAGIELEDLNEFIDLWTYAANSSASTIGEFGDSMLRMGSTMRFAANPEELMTLIAVTADAGAVGSEAGTMVRNSIMRLIAPTQKAQDAMELLGATSDEVAEVMNDEALAAANAALASRGFTVFDQDTGQMRPVLDIYADLYECLADIAGGYESINKNEDALSILSAIFPTRTITEALNLLNATADGYGGLYDAMQAGAAEGYGQYAAETMMDTLNGSIEIFESKVERLKQVVGEELKGRVVDAAGFAGEMVDSLAEMEPEKFSALISGAETLALAGPALLTAGAAFRLIGLAMNPIGMAAGGLLALTTAAAVLKDLELSDFADNFGSMELDTAPFASYIRTLGEDFRNTYREAEVFRAAVDDAAASYETASAAFSSTLLTDMLTDAQLTESDKTALMGMGDEMLSAVEDGITGRADASRSFWTAFFGGNTKDPAYNEIMSRTSEACESALAEAEGIGRNLKQALIDAFTDEETPDEISQEEYQNILSYVQSYNEAMARAASESEERERKIEYEKMLHQAQTASLDEVQAVADAFAEARDEEIAAFTDLYEYNRAAAIVDGTGEAAIESADKDYQEAVDQANAKYAEGILTLWESQILQGGQAENYAWLSGIAGLYLNGGVTADTALGMLTDELGKSAYAGQGLFNTGTDRAQLGKMLGFLISDLGGEERVENLVAHYERTGNQAMADRLTQVFAMEQLVNGFEQITRAGSYGWDGLNFFGDLETTGSNNGAWVGYNQDLIGAGDAYFQTAAAAYSADIARRTVETLGGDEGPIGQFFAAVGRQIASGDPYTTDVYDARRTITGNTEQAWNELMDRLASAYDLSAVLADYGADIPIAQAGSGLETAFAAWELMYGGIDAEAYRFPVTPEADMTELEAAIDAEDGRELTVLVQGDTSLLAEAINGYNGQTLTMNLLGRQMFAEGGRATTASIFGEAGPEWAIPEEHSERTADLLDKARAASGFTWPDLLERYGGLNANANNTTTTIVYSPVIHAQDARGVDEVLHADKKRMEKWWEEKQMKDAIEVYT